MEASDIIKILAVVGLLIAELGAAVHFLRPRQVPPEGMPELVVVPSMACAMHAGFLKNGRHPKHRHVTAWWPSRGESSIRQRRWQRITVDSQVRREAAGVEALKILRGSQVVHGDRAIWMEF